MRTTLPGFDVEVDARTESTSPLSHPVTRVALGRGRGFNALNLTLYPIVRPFGPPTGVLHFHLSRLALATALTQAFPDLGCPRGQADGAQAIVAHAGFQSGYCLGVAVGIFEHGWKFVRNEFLWRAFHFEPSPARGDAAFQLHGFALGYHDAGELSGHLKKALRDDGTERLLMEAARERRTLEWMETGSDRIWVQEFARTFANGHLK